MTSDIQFLFVVTVAINALAIYCAARGIAELRRLRRQNHRTYRASFNQRLIRL